MDALLAFDIGLVFGGILLGAGAWMVLSEADLAHRSLALTSMTPTSAECSTEDGYDNMIGEDYAEDDDYDVEDGTGL